MQNNWNSRFQTIPEPGYGYMNHLMQQQYQDRLINNYKRKPFDMAEPNPLLYENYRPIGSQLGALNIQERMLHDKIYYAVHAENMNFNHAPVPMNMYFPHVQYNSYNHFLGSSMNAKYSYEKTREPPKLAIQTSMDYGYSSYSSEEPQNEICDFAESMNAASCVDDDEVFHLEMSDEKAKVKRLVNVKFGDEVPSTPHRYQEPKSTSKRFQHNPSIKRNVILKTPQLLSQTDTMSSKELTNVGCDNPNCRCLGSKEFLPRSQLKEDFILKSDGTPMLQTRLLHGIGTSNLKFGEVLCSPCELVQDENLVMYSDSDADCYDEEELPSHDLQYERRGLEIDNGVDRSAKTTSEDIYSPENSSEYAIDVYLWKCSIEERFQAKDILKLQNDGCITAEMRHTLLNWLVAVNRQFQFTLETWCIMVNILDRFLSIQALNKDCLQLVGLTAFFIAAKQEEVEPPEISELVSLCAKSYEAKQFLWMEMIILTHLNFQLMAPTLNFFVFHLVELETNLHSDLKQEHQCDKSVKKEKQWPMELTRKLIERILCEERLARIPYSVLAHALFEFLTKHFNMNCYDELDACANDEMFVDSYFKMLYVDILDQYEDDDL